jgi:hypothetical protein
MSKANGMPSMMMLLLLKRQDNPVSQLNPHFHDPRHLFSPSHPSITIMFPPTETQQHHPTLTEATSGT